MHDVFLLELIWSILFVSIFFPAGTIQKRIFITFIRGNVKMVCNCAFATLSMTVELSNTHAKWGSVCAQLRKHWEDWIEWKNNTESDWFVPRRTKRSERESLLSSKAIRIVKTPLSIWHEREKHPKPKCS